MWMLAALLMVDSTLTFTVPLAKHEYLAVATTGTGPAVVMIPGLFGSAYEFRRVVPLLTEAGLRAVVIEPLGIGGSAHPRYADYSLTAQADRIAAVLDTLGLRNAVVLGHSVSTSIALRLALRHPDLVSGVVALDGGPAEAAATKGFRRAMTYAPLIRLFGGKGLIRKKIHRYMIAASADTSWVTPEVIAGYTADAARDLDKTLDAFEGMAEAREPQKLIPALNRIARPVRLLVGSVPHDGAVPPKEIRLMRERLPMFAVDSVPDIGHFAAEERPESILTSVERVRAQRALALLAGMP